MRKTFDKYRYWMNVPAMTFLGMIFFVAGISKLLYNSDSFTPFPLLETLPIGVAQGLYSILPYIEIAIGVLLINGMLVRLAASISGAMIALFTISNIYLIAIGKGADLCGCFGMAGRLTYIDALIVDGLMAVLVTVILVCYRGNRLNLTPWFLESGHKPRCDPSLGVSGTSTIC